MTPDQWFWFELMLLVTFLVMFLFIIAVVSIAIERQFQRIADVGEKLLALVDWMEGE